MKKETKLLLASLGFAILGGVVSLTLYKKFEKPIYKTIIQQNDQPVNLAKYAPEMSVNFEHAAAQSLNAVVHIKTASTITQQFADPFYEFFYGRQPIQQHMVQGFGSGVIVSNNGFIVTNNHVINGAEEIEVILNNKSSYKAEIIGTDPNTDLALIKIEENDLPFLKYGNSEKLNVGEWVLAVGNPFNLTSTVTAGIVSAKARDINILKSNNPNASTAIESFIQTDAAVNPGNSGGALVNTLGELVGINTAIKSNTGSYAGYSFAIPSNIVKKVVEDLKEYGIVQRAFIGVSISNINTQIAEEYSIDDKNGVYISGIAANGAAEKAGIKKGDIIRMINEKKTKNVAELQEIVGQHRPGDKIKVTVERGSDLIIIPITLKNIEGNEELVEYHKKDKVFSALGAEFTVATKNELSKIDLKYGVKVKTILNGKLKRAGVKKGFIVTKINHKPIKSINDLTSQINQQKGGILIEGFYPDGRKEYYGFGL